LQGHLPIQNSWTILEAEHRLIYLQIPYHCQTILTGRRQDMRHLPIPTHTRYTHVLVEVRATWTEYLWRVEVLLYVHHQHVLSSHCQ
jgi:hypothetical protein